MVEEDFEVLLRSGAGHSGILERFPYECGLDPTHDDEAVMNGAPRVGRYPDLCLHRDRVGLRPVRGESRSSGIRFL